MSTEPGTMVTAMTGQKGEDNQNRTAQNRTARTGQPEQESQNRTARTEQPGQGKQTVQT
jgi:hypothetical protein